MDELVHAVETVLRGTDCSLLLTFGRAGDAFQRRVRSLSGKVDGLLVTEDVLPASQLRTLARRIPVVAIAGQRQEREVDVVAVDNAAGIRALAAHLIEEHGYQRLAFLAGPADSPDARERLVAFRQAVREHPGCVLDPVLEGDFSEASGTAAARALFELRSPARGHRLRQRPDGDRHAAPAAGGRAAGARRHRGHRFR